MACSSIGPGGTSCDESRPPMDILIGPDGQLRHIYNDNLDLAELGPITISRASHVEPDTSGHWIVDLSPVNGPQFGPFVKRSAALAAEVAWLEQQGLPVPVV